MINSKQVCKKMAESTSDWDSMSEPREEAADEEGPRPQKSGPVRKPPKPRREPPFDFRYY